MNNADTIFNAAMKAGFTKEGTSALLANLQAESALNPINLEDTKNRLLGMTDQQYTDAVDSGRYQNFASDDCGYGLAQWTWGPRKRNLLAFAIRRGSSIGDMNMQLDFLFEEMQQDYGVIWNVCRTSHDLEFLVHELLYKWENPDEKENNMRIRMGYAQAWYQKYSNWSGSINSGQEGIGMTTEQVIKKVLDLARSEIGYHESGENVTKYASDLDRTNWYNGPKNGFAWCDVFVDWLFWKCFGDPLGRNMICQPTGSAGAGCLYSAQYYKGAGRWYTTNPQPGDQIFFTYSPGEYSHTGIVESVSAGTVTTIEGNTSDSVARRQYTLGSSQIAGYGRPKWELASGQRSSEIPSSGVSGSSSSDYVCILKKGMTGDDVKKLQKDLQKLGYELGRWGVDGDFGNDTYDAVMNFQRDHGLEADGEAGPLTFAALEKALKEADSEISSGQNQNGSTLPINEDFVPEIGVTEIRNGDKGNLVKLAQACLSCLGYSVSIDGIFGNELEKKIREFQKINGLESDGVIGEASWMKLLAIPFCDSKHTTIGQGRCVR